MLFIRLVGQLYAEALSRYSDLDIDLSSVMLREAFQLKNVTKSGKSPQSS